MIDTTNLSEGEKCWRAYKLKCETSFKTRNGTIACKALPRPKHTGYKKPEYISEHEGRTASLFGLLYSYEYHSTAVPINRVDAFSVMLMLLCHDIGEIYTGDALDDGTAPHDRNRKIEQAVLEELYSYFPNSEQMLGIQNDFEDYSGEKIVQYAKMVDKAEAVAFQLFLKTKGIAGDVAKKSPPSQRDLRFAKILGTSAAIDVWTLHYRIATKNIQPDNFTYRLNEFLKAGFIDAYGHIPKCLTIDVANLELD